MKADTSRNKDSSAGGCVCVQSSWRLGDDGWAGAGGGGVLFFPFSVCGAPHHCSKVFLKKPINSLPAFPKKSPLPSGCTAGGGLLCLLLVPSPSVDKELEVDCMTGDLENRGCLENSLLSVGARQKRDTLAVSYYC